MAQCENPLYIKNPKTGRGNDVPCGKCLSCIQRRRSIWTFRILQELRVAESAYFVTLTYGENIPVILKDGEYVTTLVKEDLQLFLKRLRARITKDFNKDSRWMKQSEKTLKWSPKVRYYACGEYGHLGNRAHYHLVLYNVPLRYFKPDPVNGGIYSDVLEEVWSNGIVHVGEVTRASAHYMSKHNVITAQEWSETDPRQRPFTFMSKKPGIGANYVNDTNRNYIDSTKNPFTRLKSGIPQPIGRYYRKKFFPEEEIGDGFSVRSKSEKELIKKARKNVEDDEKRKMEKFLIQAEGDVDEAEELRVKAKMEHTFENYRKIKRDLNKGRKL